MWLSTVLFPLYLYMLSSTEIKWWNDDVCLSVWLLVRLAACVCWHVLRVGYRWTSRSRRCARSLPSHTSRRLLASRTPLTILLIILLIPPSPQLLSSSLSCHTSSCVTIGTPLLMVAYSLWYSKKRRAAQQSIHPVKQLYQLSGLLLTNLSCVSYLFSTSVFREINCSN